MIRDNKAEALEASGLYRRAANRWLDVMALATDEAGREQAAHNRKRCLELARMPPPSKESVSDIAEISRAATRELDRMGVAHPNGNAFRQHSSKVKVR
jgi:hypothetical protein